MVVLNILKGLKREDWEPSLVYLYEHTNVVTIRDECEHAKIPAEWVGARSKGIVEGVWKTWRYLRRERPAVFHCHLPNAALIGTLAGVLAGVSVIVVHEHNTHAFFSPKLRFVLRLVRPFVSLTVCYSETVEQELFHTEHTLWNPPKTFPGRAVTILNGVDLSGIAEARAHVNREEKRSTLGIPQDAIIVMSVARLVAWKGQRELVQAFAQVADHFPKAVLVLVGDGQMSEEIRELTKTLGIADRVFITGGRKDVFELLTIADIYSAVYIYPPEAKGKGEESIGIATLEAMGAGIPTIAADYPSAYKFITPGENGLLARPGDVEDLAQKLGVLLGDMTTRKRLGAPSQGFVEKKLAWHSLVAIYEKLYTMIT